MSEYAGVIVANTNAPCEQFGTLAIQCDATGTVRPLPRHIEADYQQHGPQLHFRKAVRFGVNESGISHVQTAPRERCTSHVPC